MMGHMSLLYLSLAPVVAFILGAVVFSLIGLVHKTPRSNHPSLPANYQNGH
ncbi:hypothetical protein [Paraglaciecola sp.]|uniref:hypothetical protein n=1 Tax=Paraglaciecola sp. TaxID=1920173 RepID=UPI0030F4B272